MAPSGRRLSPMKLVLNLMIFILLTGSNLADINPFRSHTGNNLTLEFMRKKIIGFHKVELFANWRGKTVKDNGTI